MTRTNLALLLALISLPACGTDPPPRPAGLVCDSCGACDEAIPPKSANHVLTPIDYPDPPPTGGDHYPCWATWGVHADVVPVERWVHNLEHGGVVFLYKNPAALAYAGNSSADGGTLGELTALVQRLPRTLLTQYDALPKAFAMVSWGHRIVSDCVDTKAAETFYHQHFNEGPEDIPDDPSCD